MYKPKGHKAEAEKQWHSADSSNKDVFEGDEKQKLERERRKVEMQTAKKVLREEHSSEHPVTAKVCSRFLNNLVRATDRLHRKCAKASVCTATSIPSGKAERLY